MKKKLSISLLTNYKRLNAKTIIIAFIEKILFVFEILKK